jgi:hypothetical protein
MYSIIFTYELFVEPPPAKTPLVELEAAPIIDRVVVNDPKKVELPVVAMVM